MIKLVSLYTKHLDLNGDQANLQVLVKRLSWFGIQAEILSVEKGKGIPADADLVFLGHGSMAAWADIDADFVALVPQLKQMISSGTAFMAVASGHERAIQLALFPGTTNQAIRISKFEIADLKGREVLGYLNSATDAPAIQKHDLLLGTQLHGPMFAKNPEFADSYLAEIAAARGIVFPGQMVSDAKNDANLVAGIVRQVWELERELASE